MKTEAGAIARAAIIRLYEVARSGSVKSASSAADDFCTVLNSLMQCGAEDCEDATIMRARHHAICSEIDRWLTDPSLTVERLVSALPFSRAGLYRHFDGKAGIASYFRQRRLGIAFQKLSATEPSKGAVGRIAGDVGYASTHSFTKAFRTAFNFTPGEILGTKTTDPEGIPPAVSNAVSADEGGQAFRRAFHSIRSAE